MEIAVSSKAQALLSNATKAASFTAYQNSKSQIIIHADIGTLTEVGESWDSDCKYFVGVVDEQETSVTLHPADVVQVSTFVKKTENSKRKNAIAREQLGEAFGSKKMRQTIKSKEQNKIDAASVNKTSEAVNLAVAQAAQILPSATEISEQALGDRYIPAFNMEATSPEFVYDVNDIIPLALVDTLNVKEVLIMKKKEDILPWVSRVCKSNYVVELVVQKLKEKKNAKLLKKILFLMYAIRFYSMNAKIVSKMLNPDLKSDEGSKNVIPLPILEYFANTFMQRVVDEDGSVQYLRSDLMRDKGLSYLLCMILCLDGYSANVGLIATDLKIARKKVAGMFRELGCKVDGENAKLVVPLTFPKRSRGN